MAEKNVDTGAQGTQDPKEETNPFEGFQSEAFANGEPIEPEKTDPAEKPATAPPAKEKPPKPEAPAAGEGDDPAAGTGDDEGGDPDAGETGEDGQPRKKPQTAQERINELTRARREEERQRKAAERRLEEAERRLQELSKPAAAKPEAEKKTAADKKPAEDDGAPNPEDYDFGELDSRYIAAVVRYQTEKSVADIQARQEQERSARQAEEAQATAVQKFHTLAEKAAEKYEDYHDIVIIGAQNGEWPLSAELGSLIVDSDVGADIAYHLATHPEEAASVYRQTPVEQARYFGRMEAQFSAEQSAAPGGKPAEKTATAKTPRAPAPLKPGSGAGGRPNVTANTDDFAAFEAVALEKL